MELPFPSSHTKPKRQIHFRNVKNINMDALALDLQHLSSGSTDSLSVADSVNLYNQSLSSLLDLHAPLTSSGRAAPAGGTRRKPGSSAPGVQSLSLPDCRRAPPARAADCRRSFSGSPEEETSRRKGLYSRS
ncbi:unnamed protein product [Boreogadus saida]